MRIENSVPVTTVSMINASGWDADLVVPAARRITVDHITETTALHHVFFDTWLQVAAGGIVNGAGLPLYSDHITETSVGHGVYHDVNVLVNPASNFYADLIGELTGGHGIEVGFGVLKVDHVGEYTPGHNIILNNTETGRQGGTGNSATGAVNAFTMSGGEEGANCIICGAFVQRTGTYRVWAYNHVAAGANGGIVLQKNNNVLLATGTLNNAGQTNEDLGDIALTAGDVVFGRYTAVPPAAGQLMVFTFKNADGMWT